MGYPKYKKTLVGQINIQKIMAELTCRYCGRGFSSIAQLHGHIGQCVKRGAFLKKLEQGVIVIVHRRYFHIMPKSISALKHVETFLELYRERNSQPELWEKDINTFLGALTALHMEKKLTFEIIDKDEAIKRAHSVAGVYTDGGTPESQPMAPIVEIPETEVVQKSEPEEEKEVKPLIEVLREKKLRGHTKKKMD